MFCFKTNLLITKICIYVHSVHIRFKKEEERERDDIIKHRFMILLFQNLTPLIFSFELPIMGASQSTPDCTSPYVVKIQEKYNVQVMFRTRPKLHATLVVVKGCEWEVSQVKEATVLLIRYMCKNLAVSIHQIVIITKSRVVLFKNLKNWLKLKFP